MKKKEKLRGTPGQNKSTKRTKKWSKIAYRSGREGEKQKTAQEKKRGST